jgi:GNAT superfamily N-acetyltransferase
MDNAELHALEQAAFDAWPALEETDHQGWRLRFAHGHTKRANSANAIAPMPELGASQIAVIEQFYRDRGLPPVVRLASFCTSQAADDALADRGYRYAGISLVMTRPLAPAGRPHEPCGSAAGDTAWGATDARALHPGSQRGPHHKTQDGASSRPDPATDIAAWLADHRDISGGPATVTPAHRQILQRIRGETRLLVTRADGRAVCCGLGVRSGDFVGLFQIATRPDCRGHGLATELCAELVRWGAARGARSAYLQVEAGNTGAVRIYEALGFRRSYHYWYRIA